MRYWYDCEIRIRREEVVSLKNGATLDDPVMAVAAIKTISRILIVEDDPNSRTFLQFALTRPGVEVLTAEDALSARNLLLRDGVTSFHCVVTDHRMPDQTGLELMAWIKEQDASLAAILVTAEGERCLITESLRSGAVDFLEKPIDVFRLRAAVNRAITQTQRQRHLAESESAIKNLGHMQKWMLGGNTGMSQISTDLCFHPKREAGGDFFTRFQPQPHQVFCLLTDVSGHDAKAAYISAYFQGIVRGMVECQSEIEDIFATFNRILLNEWNGGENLASEESEVGASVAASGILIDLVACTATVLSHGMPAPVYWKPDGAAISMGEKGGFPLGWFGNLAPRAFIQKIADGGAFTWWTDGLEEMASQKGVSNLSLAYALQSAKARQASFPGIETATDDILAADIHLPLPDPAAEKFRPLILENYAGDQSPQIDHLQVKWRNSFRLAIPELPDATLHDALLCARECVLNALQHGCKTCACQRISFQCAYSTGAKTLRIRVSDPGPGHHFDTEKQEVCVADALTELHRGLILINRLATKVKSERNGAHITMDFTHS